MGPLSWHNYSGPRIRLPSHQLRGNITFFFFFCYLWPLLHGMGISREEEKYEVGFCTSARRFSIMLQQIVVRYKHSQKIS